MVKWALKILALNCRWRSIIACSVFLRSFYLRPVPCAQNSGSPLISMIDLIASDGIILPVSDGLQASEKVAVYSWQSFCVKGLSNWETASTTSIQLGVSKCLLNIELVCFVLFFRFTIKQTRWLRLCHCECDESQASTSQPPDSP